MTPEKKKRIEEIAASCDFNCCDPYSEAVDALTELAIENDKEIESLRESFTIQRDNYLRLYGAIMEGGTQSSMLIDPVDVVKRLQAELAESKADWNGLRDAVYGQNDYPSVNRADAELEANRIREKNRELQAQLLSLQSHNAKLRDCLRMAMIGSCSCLTKTDAPEFHEPDCVYRMIKECLASQPDHELRDRVVAMLKDKYDAMEAACNDDEMRGRSSFWVPYYRHFQKFITELLPSL